MKIAMLDQLATRIASIKRKRSPMEPAVAITNAYVDCLFAVGYAHVGASAVATARYQSARAALADQLGDPIHAWLLDAFAMRIELATTGRTTEPFDDGLVDRLEALARPSRYKVDRLREAARLLEPELGWLDAIRGFKYKPSPIRRVGRDVETADARMHRLEAELGGRPTPKAVAEILASTARLPDAFAVECLDRALEITDRLPEACVEIFEEALSIVDRSRRFDRIPRILEHLRAADGRLSVNEVANQLSTVASIYLGAGEMTAARAASAELDSYARVHPKTVATAKDLRAELAKPSTSPTTPARLRALRTAALASTTAPDDAALSTLLRLADEVVFVTDSFGTNSHFCLSVLDLVDALVSAVVSRAAA